MAALLLSCFGIASSKVRESRRAKAEREKEYTENFEVLKEENAKRVRQLSNHGSWDGSTQHSTRSFSDAHRTPEMQQHFDHHQQQQAGVTTTAVHSSPPKYDDVVEGTAPRHSG